MRDIKEALRNDQVVIGVCNDISDPSAVGILGDTGWDFVIINCEGGTMSIYGAELENQIRAAYIADVTPAVKVPKNDPAMIASALNLGAKMIEVPGINTKEDITAAVRAAKYPPLGNRMTCWGTPAQKYGAVPWPEFVRQSNEEVTIFAVLEEKEAMDNMEEILSVEGLDVAGIGYLDLALKLGGIDDPDIEAQVAEYGEKLLTLCKQKGVCMGKGVADVDAARAAIAAGCRFLWFGSDDATMLRSASAKWVTDLRKVIKELS